MHLKVGMRQGLFHSEARHWIECQKLVQHVQQPDHVIMIDVCDDEYDDEDRTHVESLRTLAPCPDRSSPKIREGELAT